MSARVRVACVYVLTDCCEASPKLAAADGGECGAAGAGVFASDIGFAIFMNHTNARDRRKKKSALIKHADEHARTY